MNNDQFQHACRFIASIMGHKVNDWLEYKDSRIAIRSCRVNLEMEVYLLPGNGGSGSYANPVLMTDNVGHEYRWYSEASYLFDHVRGLLSEAASRI